MHLCVRDVFCLFCRYGSGSESSLLLHLPGLDRISRNCIPHRWSQLYWRCISAGKIKICLYFLILTPSQIERATALGWFLSGTLIGPAFGPFIGGIIITFRSWRDIFWLQTALAGFGTVLVIFVLPETIHHKKSTDLNGLTRREYAHRIWQMTNPFRVIRLFRYPNLLTVVCCPFN